MLYANVAVQEKYVASVEFPSKVDCGRGVQRTRRPKCKVGDYDFGLTACEGDLYGVGASRGFRGEVECDRRTA